MQYTVLHTVYTAKYHSAMRHFAKLCQITL